MNHADCRDFVREETKMRQIALLGMLIVLSTGCGRSWMPYLFRGAPCQSGCGANAPALPAPLPADKGCTNCGNAASAGYGVYEEEVVGGDYYGSGVLYDGSSLPGNAVGEGVLSTPPMVPPQSEQ